MHIGSDFLDNIRKAQSIKEKGDKLDFVEIKICSGKDTVKGMKRQAYRLGESCRAPV